jgi:hypothetical protein
VSVDDDDLKRMCREMFAHARSRYGEPLGRGYSEGGYIMPGTVRGSNDTGKPEPVRPLSG